jgi:dTDP-4-dehydrorhamnose 3,5-epimerase
MKATPTSLPGVLVLDPVVHEDDRGLFFESFNRDTFAGLGIDVLFAQSNVSRSRRGVLRGMHYQWPNPQGKLINVLEGEVLDIAADIRPDSPTFRQWIAVSLTAENRRQLWIPEGYAHGFCTVSDQATISYQCTTPYDRAADASIRWNDADLAIDWPVSDPLLSAKDERAPFLADIDPTRLPRLLP